jgi:hypothetical protein
MRLPCVYSASAVFASKRPSAATLKADFQATPGALLRKGTEGRNMQFDVQKWSSIRHIHIGDQQAIQLSATQPNSRKTKVIRLCREVSCKKAAFLVSIEGRTTNWNVGRLCEEQCDRLAFSMRVKS